jgi:hypothetical protein
LNTTARGGKSEKFRNRASDKTENAGTISHSGGE